MNRHLKIMFAVAIVLAMVLSACGPAATAVPTKAPTAVPTKAKRRLRHCSQGSLVTSRGISLVSKASRELRKSVASRSPTVKMSPKMSSLRPSETTSQKDMTWSSASGGEYEDALATIAGEHPDIQFGVTDGAARNPNMSATKLSCRQMGYLAGILACNMTKSNHAAYVVGELVGGTDEGIEGYKLGIATCGKDIKVDYIATGDWADVAMAREAGLALISDGVDVLWHMLDTADAGLISAAEDKGVWAIGLYRDSSPLGPNVVLGSTTGSPGLMIYELACGHGVPGETIPVTVNTTPEGIDVHLTDLTPKDVQQKVLDALEKMRSGEIAIEP